MAKLTYEAAVKLFEENLSFVHYFVHRYFPNLAKDEDIMQEAFIGFWKACKAYDESKGRLSTLASTCIMNAILMELRRRKSSAKVEACSIEDQVPDQDDLTFDGLLIDPAGGPEDSGIFAKDFIDSLKGIDRRIVELQLTGLTQAQAAKELGFSQSYYSRRLKRLRNLYKIHFEGVIT